MLLKVEDIHTYYGFSYILQGISFEVDQGEAVALLGKERRREDDDIEEHHWS